MARPEARRGDRAPSWRSSRRTVGHPDRERARRPRSSPRTRSTPRRPTSSATSCSTRPGRSATSGIDQLRTPDLAAWRATLPGAVAAPALPLVPAGARAGGHLAADRPQPVRPDPQPARQARREPRDPPVRGLGRGRGDRRRADPRLPGAPGRSSSAPGCGPEEALALEWQRHRHGRTRSRRIERVHSQGRTKPCKKSDRQRRRVPLRARVLEALDGHPRRIDTPARVPRPRRRLPQARRRSACATGQPALRAAGIEHRGVYACRHTFAAWSIAAGVQLFYLRGSWARR